ncbi:MAG: hypothetical protein K2X45_07925 [Phreatobacter sp.]|nr:hypothetical protein [Phreatobacter sp.]
MSKPKPMKYAVVALRDGKAVESMTTYFDAKDEAEREAGALRGRLKKLTVEVRPMPTDICVIN